MYLLTEYVPYEGHSVSEFASLEEVKKVLKISLNSWRGRDTYNFDLYKVVEEIDVDQLMKEEV